MIRSTGRAVARALLPSAAKRWLNPWRFGNKSFGAAGPRLSVEADGTVSIPPDIRLRAAGPILDELRDHFVHHAESREEMAGFLADARSRPGVLFDVGAHQGLFSLVFCAARPDNRVFLYDPSPSAMRIACDGIAQNGFSARATACTTAIGARRGTASMVLQPSGFAAHVGQGTPDTFHALVATVDDECARYGVQPTIVKIDTEGDELEVLRGAARTLESARPVLFIELHLDLLDQRGSSARELCDYLREHGYSLYSPLGRRLLPLAVHQSLRAVRRVVARPVRPCRSR
ncbi:MAG TPA: FkbM family methyltransferase [Vicinamibacterales bacterium]|jgi:FkbM family methyltransferase|nr:FkbM family methyltransferase [Vicinamibacterales bacterium]